MYNRYIPEDVSYTPIEPPPEQATTPGSGPRPSFPFSDFLSGKESLSGLLGIREGNSLSGLLKSLRLDTIDPGDILLLLILLYLLVEGDDLELVIALGLTLLMGLGDDKEKEFISQRNEGSLHPEG